MFFSYLYFVFKFESIILFFYLKNNNKFHVCVFFLDLYRQKKKRDPAYAYFGHFLVGWGEFHGKGGLSHAFFDRFEVGPTFSDTKEETKMTRGVRTRHSDDCHVWIFRALKKRVGLPSHFF